MSIAQKFNKISTHFTIVSLTAEFLGLCLTFRRNE